MRHARFTSLACFVVITAMSTGIAGAATFSITFQSYPVGPLGSPWYGSAAGSSFASVANVGGGNRALRLYGGTAAGDYASYSTSFASTSADQSIDFDLYPVANASPALTVYGTGYSTHKSWRIWRDPSTGVLAANASSGIANCAKLPAGRWSHVTIRLHPGTQTFDVLVKNAATACTRVSMLLGSPYHGVGVLDQSNEGWGGDSYFDNFAGH